jgi:hypothetical protein
MSPTLAAPSRISGASNPVAPSTLPEREQNEYSSHVRPFGTDPEPPEDSVRLTEAPETWQRGHAEAPDAGHGAPDSSEHGFRQGRCRS